MLNAKAVTESLLQTLGNGVETVMVIGLTGDVLGQATVASPGDRSFMEQGLMTAVATNMWQAYASNDLTRTHQQAMNNIDPAPESLEMMFTSVGDHQLCLACVGGAAILCLSGRSVQQGMLKIKAAALQKHLDGPLRAVLRK